MGARVRSRPKSGDRLTSMAEYKSFIADVSGGEGSRCRHTLRLDTYGCGCAHDCAYCYAKAMLEFRGNWHPEDPHVADPGRVREAVGELELAHVQISITSTSDGANAFKERAPAPSRRMRAVERLCEAGFDVCTRLSPYMPEFIDLRLLRDRTGCGKVLVEFLRVNGNIKKVLDIDYRPYTLKLGGYRHLPLRTKKELLKPILETFDEVSVCEDVYSRWAVWQQTVNANPDDCCNLRGV